MFSRFLTRSYLTVLLMRLQVCFKRIQALESRQQTDVESGLASIAAYGLRRKYDFDKYAALALAEDLVVVAQNTKHE